MGTRVGTGVEAASRFGPAGSPTLGLAGAAVLEAIAADDGPLGRRARWIGIACNGLGVAIFLPVIGIGVSLVSVLILVVWWAIVGWRLLGLARATSPRAVSVPQPRPAAA